MSDLNGSLTGMANWAYLLDCGHRYVFASDRDEVAAFKATSRGYPGEPLTVRCRDEQCRSVLRVATMTGVEPTDEAPVNEFAHRLDLMPETVDDVTVAAMAEAAGVPEDRLEDLRADMQADLDWDREVTALFARMENEKPGQFDVGTLFRGLSRLAELAPQPPSKDGAAES